MENPSIQPDLSGNDYIIERQLKPEPRRDVIEELRKRGVKPTSMIDISDGLASEIFHLCRQSNVGCELYEDKIPIDQQTYERAREFGLDPSVCALSGGAATGNGFPWGKSLWTTRKPIRSLGEFCTHEPRFAERRKRIIEE